VDAKKFWDVIAHYNQDTWVIQIIFIFMIIFSAAILYKRKNQWLLQIALGLTNLFIGIVFFIVYGTEPIQMFFAAPLYIITGLLFVTEGTMRRDNEFLKLSKIQLLLLILVVLYPAISLLLGKSYPKIVFYIMPCPVISLSIVIYSCYKYKNKLLLILLTVWGLTGIKSFLFNAYEDVILLICGVYCLYILIKEIKFGTNGSRRAID
jgi:hypothetical protein